MRKATSTNSLNRRVLGEHCVVHEALARLALRWKVGVLQAIAHGATTYSDLKRALPAVTDQMLATRLRELVADRLITKATNGPRDPSPRYATTAAGDEALDIAVAICRWAAKHPRSAA